MPGLDPQGGAQRRTDGPNTNLKDPGRKAARGVSVRRRWQQTVSSAGYLRASHWRRPDETWTIAERPARATELLPWAVADGRLRILARPGSGACAACKTARPRGRGESDGLGRRLFSSLGITTERVYPFIADAGTLPRNITEALVFCRLSDVLAQPNKIADGHLLIAASRAGHLFGTASAG
jgi:hypothetical protein